MSENHLKQLRTVSPELPLIEASFIDEQIGKSVTFSVFRDGNTRTNCDGSFILDLQELSQDVTFMNKLSKFKKNCKPTKAIETRILQDFTRIVNFNNFYIPSKYFNDSVDLPHIDKEKWNKIKAKNDSKDEKKSNVKRSNFVRNIINLLMKRNKKVTTSWLHYDIAQEAQGSPDENLLQEYDSIDTLENYCNNCTSKDIIIEKQAKEIKYLKQRLRRSNDNSLNSSSSSILTRRTSDVDLPSTEASSIVSVLQSNLQDQVSKIRAQNKAMNKAIDDFGGRDGGRNELRSPMIAYVIGLITKTKLSNRRAESVLEELPNHLKIFTRY